MTRWAFATLTSVLGAVSHVTGYSTATCFAVLILGLLVRPIRELAQALSLWLRMPLAFYAWATGAAFALAQFGWVGFFLYWCFLPLGAIGASLVAAAISWFDGSAGQAWEIVLAVTVPLALMSGGSLLLGLLIVRFQERQERTMSENLYEAARR